MQNKKTIPKLESEPISWDDFKSVVCGQMENYRNYIYRGQANLNWQLKTTLHRTGVVTETEDFLWYFEHILPYVQEPIETWDGSRRDLTNPSQLAEFLGFLQHHRFPTPLLDWTFSPYIAAYFAFEGINHFAPQSDSVAIYTFNQSEWLAKYMQTYDYKDVKPHVTLLNPTYRGNPKQMLQQGTFIFTNQPYVEEHIMLHENFPGQFLKKYEISVKERKKIFVELNAMNITAMQLAPSMESVCKKAYEDICTALNMGLTPKEVEELLNKYSAIKPTLEKK